MIWLKFHILRLIFKILFAIIFLILIKILCDVWKIWRSENEIFGFWNISDSSSSFLTFGWFIVWIEDLVVGIQSWNRKKTPINIWLMFFIEWDNSFITFNWKFFLNNQKQNFFFRRIETLKIWDFIHFWTIFNLVFNSN